MSEPMDPVLEQSKSSKYVSWGRRTFLINPRFQLSFMAYTVGISLVTIGVFYAADAYFFWKFSQLGQGLGLPSNHVFFQFIEEQRSTKNFYYAITAGVTLSFLVIWGVLLSHRVAGPLYHLCRHAKQVALGESTSDVHFRKGDFFQEVAEAYNEQMVRYRKLLDEHGGGTPDGHEPTKPKDQSAA
jgi:hypothetical protein